MLLGQLSDQVMMLMLQTGGCLLMLLQLMTDELLMLFCQVSLLLLMLGRQAGGFSLVLCLCKHVTSMHTTAR